MPTRRSRASTPRRPRRCPAWSTIFTGKDIADAKVGGLICGWVVKDKHGQPHKAPPHPVMALDTVRYVGDTVAMVVADSHDEAKDAAEAIKVDYEVLPANVDLGQGARQGRARRSTPKRRAT